jgi:eukaryotic-like serine/threonine-protein kinase
MHQPDDAPRSAPEVAPIGVCCPPAEPAPGGSAATHTAPGLAGRTDRAPADEPPLSKSIPPLIDGTYRVLRLLGRGSMGSVVLAHDTRLERDVAIKVIRPEYVDSPEALDRFRQEARAMARVRDPHVVEIHALGDIAGAPYIVMEYVPGASLEATLDARGARPLPIDEAIELLDQVCRGVEAIHESGAVHRDLKPSNILVGPGGRVAVADLGLARPVSCWGPDHAPEVAGTPAYIAPEVASQQQTAPSLVARGDVYALGVIGYQLLTGQLPFDSEDIQELLWRHAHEAPRRLRLLRPDLPVGLENVVLAAMRKDPAERTAGAERFRAALLEAREALRMSYRGTRILVVDDDAACSRGVSRALVTGLPGALIETAADGEAALRSADYQPPSLAVLDLHMPRLNGFELLAALRGNPRTAGVPVVVMTATGTGRDWRLLQQLGAEGFLMKPFDMDQLLSTVRGVLSRHAPPAGPVSTATRSSRAPRPDSST